MALTVVTLSPVTGYFGAQADRFDMAGLEALQIRHPEAVILHFTTSLARNNGLGTVDG